VVHEVLDLMVMLLEFKGSTFKNKKINKMVFVYQSQKKEAAYNLLRPRKRKKEENAHYLLLYIYGRYQRRITSQLGFEIDRQSPTRLKAI
jgi:hypothetical protein